MTKQIIFSLMAVAALTSCNGNKAANADQVAESASTDTVAVCSFQDCDVTLNGIHFTKMLNDADQQVEEKDGIITFTAPEGTDLFIDPDEKLTQNSAKVLFTEVDNSKPFTFIARMKPGFTPAGLYHQAALVVMANDTLYQKFTFEQDERGKHRIVTVRTMGTSDDNNHEVISQDHVYYKISSDTKTIAYYASLDNKEWQMIRLYKNYYPKDLKIGISSMAPQKDICVSEFSELQLSTDNVNDFRMGE